MDMVSATLQTLNYTSILVAVATEPDPVFQFWTLFNRLDYFARLV